MMLFGCLLPARYVFQADVWKKTVTTNSAGQQVSKWIMEKTVLCIAQAITEGGLRSIGTTEKFDTKYYNIDWIKLITSVPLRRGDRVTNVRQKGFSSAIWVEEELRGKPPTWFNVNGSAPMTDHTGRVIEYQTLLQRSEVQGHGN